MNGNNKREIERKRRKRGKEGGRERVSVCGEMKKEELLKR